MPLKLEPATEADTERAARIEADAYAEHPVDAILFPGPFPPLVAGQRSPRAEALRRILRDDPSVYMFKVIDTDVEPSDDNKQMIGFTQWGINDGSQLPLTKKTFGPGANIEACETVFGSMEAIRHERIKTKHVRKLVTGFSFPGNGNNNEAHVEDLKSLIVDPKHQRRGAGRMLVMWGIEEFKKLGLPFFLEATAMGHSLYLSCGFRDIDVVTVDLSKWGGPEEMTYYVMARDNQA
ncbi:acyl-CoA N-acyltransferase [Xylaria nigripes]|nr:acyl-CoA N-acyltransferase [Xylaria nigripes]